MAIDTTRRIAQTLYFSLTGVDYLQSKGLSYVFCRFFDRMLYNFRSGVDLAAKILTG